MRLSRRVGIGVSLAVWELLMLRRTPSLGIYSGGMCATLDVEEEPASPRGIESVLHSSFGGLMLMETRGGDPRFPRLLLMQGPRAERLRRRTAAVTATVVFISVLLVLL